MRALKHKSIEFSEVLLSELGQEMRFDSEYWEPAYIRNEDLLKSKKHKQTKQLAHTIQYGISIAMNETGIGYPILKMDNIMDMLAEDKDSKFADISAKTFQHFELKKFDVLFNRVNSDEFVGRTGIYLLDGEHTFASYLVKVDTQKLHTNCYLTVFLNCKYGKISLQRVKRRAVNQANINAKELSNLNIPLPSEAFQKTIQELVVEAQKQKVLSEKLYKEAEEILLDELGLLHWKPKTVSFKINGVEKTVENTINEVMLSEIESHNRLDSEYWQPKFFDIETIIQNINYVRLKDLCLLINHGKQPPYITGGEIPVFSQKWINDKRIDYAFLNDTEEPKTSLTFSKKYPEYVAKKYDIFHYSVGANIGFCHNYLLDNPVMPGSFITLIRVNNSKINPIYVGLTLNTLIGRLQSERRKSGTSQPYIYPKDICKFLIPLLNDKIQLKISNKVLESHSAIIKTKKLLETAKKTVEIFIEQNEKEALNYLKLNLR